MFLKSLYLKNFRNFAEAELSFAPRLNVIYGDNGQGKTNLLEAIYLLATGRSFRTQHLKEVIRFGESSFYLAAEYVQQNISHSVKLSFNGEMRNLQINANTYSSFQPLLGILPAILYTPSDIELIMGPPAIRRRFLNLHLAQTDPVYVHHLARFWRAMQQRNCLLREKKSQSIECWETEMAHSATHLLAMRKKFLQALAAPLNQYSNRLCTPSETYEIKFHPTYNMENYLQQLQKNRMREMDLGKTSTGPHRDDFTIFIEGKKADAFASEGQKKTSIAALRLAEWEMLGSAKALLGIDDLGLHLDETRQKLLRMSLEQAGQVFVTIPYLPSTWTELQNGHLIQVKNDK